ncbi:uncharacterized protein LOC134842693 [Symsagittifera roscoffensis]|uniref:uncharacterized protein LOC134841512 n=1 Tax=Symsagittifera roscoffensis TaxID=84072 RepID=UPI00307C3280
MGDGADFQTGVFSCFSDKTLCLMSFMFPNYVFGRIAEVVLMEGENYYTGVLKYKDNECPRIVDSLMWMSMFSAPALCFIRQKLRKQLGHEQESKEIEDFIFSCCCPCCVTYQMAKEMKFAPLARA